jgi:hypothetical protein
MRQKIKYVWNQGSNDKKMDFLVQSLSHIPRWVRLVQKTRTKNSHAWAPFRFSPSPAGMSLTKLSLAGNNLIISCQEGRVWLMTSRLETGKLLTYFYSVDTLLIDVKVPFFIRLFSVEVKFDYRSCNCKEHRGQRLEQRP